jgi:hypothetical protein
MTHNGLQLSCVRNSNGGLCGFSPYDVEMKKFSPAVGRDNLLNFPTLRLLADASFPKLYSRVIAVHHLQFPPTREPLPNIGYRGAVQPGKGFSSFEFIEELFFL